MRLLLHAVPAQTGLRWITLGWRAFRKAPLAFSSLLALYLVATLVFTMVPVLGPLVALGALPVLSLVAMLYTHQVMQERMVSWGLIAQPFKLSRPRLRSQLALGAMFVVAVVLMMFASHLVDGGALRNLSDELAKVPADDKAVEASMAAIERALQDDAFWSGLLFRTIGMLLIATLFSFAPALIHWGGQGAVQALFSNLVGLWRNKAAFALNGLGWLGIQMAANVVLAAIGLVGSPALAQLFVMPVILMMASVFYASLYFMFVDTYRFAADEPVTADTPPADTPPSA